MKTANHRRIWEDGVGGDIQGHRKAKVSERVWFVQEHNKGGHCGWNMGNKAERVDDATMEKQAGETMQAMVRLAT